MTGPAIRSIRINDQRRVSSKFVTGDAVDVEIFDYHYAKDMPKVPYATRGEILKEGLLTPMNISTCALAKAIHVPAPRISEIIAGRCAITADSGLRLARFFRLNDGF